MLQILAPTVLTRLPPSTTKTHPAALASSSHKPCHGFDVCPEFPMPYNGTYPTWYPYWEGQRQFPEDFLWMVGTSAYQIEGAYNEGGRGASIWDTFNGANTAGMKGSVCTAAPCPINSLMRGAMGATGNVANDHYHHYKKDVQLIADLKLNAYRFSIAWTRIYPTGDAADGVNAEGVAFYHNLIDALLDKGIEPVITMYHWDLPQGLMDASPHTTPPVCDRSYKQGWYECVKGFGGLGENKDIIPSGRTSNIVKHFSAYARLLLTEYGPKVKKWATFNEAWTFTFLGSGKGKAPSVQPYMDMDIWPLVAGHNVILAHASAVAIFRSMQKTGRLQVGSMIGITNNQDWREPSSGSVLDIAAAQAAVEGQLGWFADPIFGVNGVHDYPASMKKLQRYGMPTFSFADKAWLAQLRPDFFGLNHYGTGYVSFNPEDNSTTISEEGLVQAESAWLFNAAWGFRKLLNWVSNRYDTKIRAANPLPIYVTEAGWSVSATTARGAKYDIGRLMYYYTYLTEAWSAHAQDQIDLRGFASWSLMDNYEWEKGFDERFGVTFNDFKFGEDPNSPGPESPVYDAKFGAITGECGIDCLKTKIPDPSRALSQTRYAKSSALFLMDLWKTGRMTNPHRYLVTSVGEEIGTFQPTQAVRENGVEEGGDINFGSLAVRKNGK